MKFIRSRRGVAGSMVLLLCLFLFRYEVNQTRIVSSIGLALGRPVEAGSVHLRLLPRPGFDLRNFAVRDDPGFGAEPMLRASEVTAALRLRSLFVGRLEIARLTLAGPSLNLVRNAEGHWNLENLVERASKISVAPTGKTRTVRRPAFPYIEAIGGRVNFKFGQEKKAYALRDAGFSLWQESEDSWGIRLKAQPIRTDFNLSDTGIVRVNGTWQRAASLRETPLSFMLLWERAQLGQLSKLAYGADQGWRGTIKILSVLNGTPTDLAIEVDTTAEDFRRYDIPGGGQLRLAAHCSGRYSSVDKILSSIACNAPVGEGTINLDGQITSPMESRKGDLALTARGLPIQSMIALLRHVKHGVPDDLVASGQIDASVEIRRTEASSNSVWQGGGQISAFQLRSNPTNTALVLNSIPFVVSPGFDADAPTKRRKDGSGRFAFPPEPHIEVGPFHATSGRPSPMLVHGWISRSGYNFQFQGDAQMQRLLQAARIMGIPAPQPNPEASAILDTQIGGDWSGAAPKATGKAQLRSVRTRVRGFNQPLEIVSANLVFTPGQINVQSLTASAAGTSWHGSLVFPLSCTIGGSCPVRFDLHANEIAIDRLNDLLNPDAMQRPWYRFFSSSTTSGTPYLLRLNAEGRITASRLELKNLTASRVSANIELKDGKVRISSLVADVLGGKHTGELEADFSAEPPQYSGSGAFEQVSLGQLAEAMNDGWITGSATAAYRASALGSSASELFASATGALQVEAWDGVLSHIVLAKGAAPLQMRHLVADLVLRDGTFEIQNSKLESAAGIYQVGGSASLDRILNLKLTRDGFPGFNITGTLTEPHVLLVAFPETQAALKP